MVGAPSLRSRIFLSLAIGAVGYALVVASLESFPALVAKDFTWAWRAALALLQGHNPYDVIKPTGHYPFSEHFFYPLPAAVVALPVAPFGPVQAGALFFGASSALLAFALTRGGLWRLTTFLGAPYVMAAATVQWSPLVVAAALLPNLQWLAVAKPNLGLAAFVYRPSWRAALGSAAFLLLCVAIVPTWPADWLEALRHTPQHAAPVLRTGGVILLLALLRWRTPEGRLLAAMACLPQVMYFYDQYPLWLIPRGWRSSLALSALSWVGLVAWWASHPPGNGLPAAEPYVLWLVYAPSLLIVLAMPNEGRLPRLVERAMAGLRRPSARADEASR